MPVFSQDLLPKFSCYSKTQANRGFQIDIIYRPLYKTSEARILYVSEFGREIVSSVSLKKPGYTSTNIYFIEQPIDFGPLPKSTSSTTFKMVLDKRSLTGVVDFVINKNLTETARKILKVSCTNNTKFPW